jgi:hypothetical protein
MGLTSALDPAVIRTAVGDAASDDRPALLRRLTKEIPKGVTRTLLPCMDQPS